MKTIAPAATLTIRNISTLSNKEFERLINWLKKQPKEIKKNRKNYSKRFTARLY